MKCNGDCFNCQHDDCINDSIDLEDIARQNEHDKEIHKSEEIASNIDYRRRWELNNPERARAYKHRHYVKNKAVYNKHSKDNYYKDVEQSRERSRERYAANKDYHKAYYEANKNRIRERRKKLSDGQRAEYNRKRRETYAKKKLKDIA